MRSNHSAGFKNFHCVEFQLFWKQIIVLLLQLISTGISLLFSDFRCYGDATGGLQSPKSITL